MTEHPPDVRDEQVASWLAVEPLDDVARRRFIDTAVRATRRRHPRRWLAAAAALVAIAVGSAVLATNGGGGGSQAARSRSAATTAPGPVANTGTAGGRAPLSANAASAVPDLGDFGNLGDRGELDALQHAADAAAAAAAATSSPTGDASRSASSPSSRVVELERRLAAVSCASELPAGTVVGLGTGRVGGKDALVVAIARSGAPSSAVVLVAITSEPCKVRSLG